MLAPSHHKPAWEATVPSHAESTRGMDAFDGLFYLAHAPRPLVSRPIPTTRRIYPNSTPWDLPWPPHAHTQRRSTQQRPISSWLQEHVWVRVGVSVGLTHLGFDPFRGNFCETVDYFFLIMGLTQNGSKSPRVFFGGPKPPNSQHLVEETLCYAAAILCVGWAGGMWWRA